MAELRIEALRGGAAKPLIDDLARLRMEVFREWPYLYQGSLEYEKRYVQTYLDCPDSLIVVVRKGERCVGASTALPLVHAETEMQKPLADQGMDLRAVDYFGESVVLPQWRGQGLGVKFFELREAHARELGLRHCVFCAVERADDHPARPSGYVPNDGFWSRRGYAPLEGIRCHFEWPDIGSTEPTSKPMQFWIKSIQAVS